MKQSRSRRGTQSDASENEDENMDEVEFEEGDQIMKMAVTKEDVLEESEIVEDSDNDLSQFSDEEKEVSFRQNPSTESEISSEENDSEDDMEDNRDSSTYSSEEQVKPDFRKMTPEQRRQKMRELDVEVHHKINELKQLMSESEMTQSVEVVENELRAAKLPTPRRTPDAHK